MDILPGPWVQLKDPIAVPNESFLYAFDVAEYQKKVQDAVTDKTPHYPGYTIDTPYGGPSYPIPMPN